MQEASQTSSQLSPIKQAYLALEEMQARLQALEQRGREPIALIGMGCRFPGGANSPAAFWERLLNGYDAIGEVPSGRWLPDALEGLPQNARYGAFLTEPVDEFDAELFGISPREARSMDPQQRLLLEVVWEALEDAGINPRGLSGKRVGVFIGATSCDYDQLILGSGEPALLDAYYASGIARSVLSGRISYTLGLMGPSLTVDTACSSSLTVLNLAINSLRLAECDLALVGGVNLLLSPVNYLALSRFGMLSPDGRCKAFDAGADGFGRGEGCGVVVLRRLSDAQERMEPVQALILSSVTSQDGASGGLTVPNGPAQELAIRRALEAASLPPAVISYVETHGTGTSLGDPIEANALGRVFGDTRPADRPLLIGSVKANTGHLEAAAGMAGLIKLVLSLKHRVLPEHRLTQKSPFIPWERLGLEIPTKLAKWEPIDGRWVAGLSSFGFSGTNVHVIVEAAPLDPQQPVSPVERPLHILAISGNQDQALKDLADRYRERLSHDAERDFADICFSAATGRAHEQRRLALVATGPEQAVRQLNRFLDDQPDKGLLSSPLEEVGPDRPKVVFLFTGQGSQYIGMGRQLYKTSPIFRHSLERCAAILESHMDQPLLALLYPPSGESPALDNTVYTQPALFALEWSLAELWRAWGINPDFVIGHSLGEYVAACIAGVFSLEDGLRFVAARGRLIGSLPAGGAMAAVFASEDRLLPVVDRSGGRLAIAALNGATNVVISGENQALQEALVELDGQGVVWRALPVSHAFHSALLDPILPELEAEAAKIEAAAPGVRLISNLTGAESGPDLLKDPSYWSKHARQPVRFAAGIAALQQAGARIFLEVGPAPTLSNLSRRILDQSRNYGIFSSLQAGADDWQQMLSSLAGLYTRGCRVDWEGFDRGYSRQRVSLPTYPFQRQRFWFSSGTHKSAEEAAAARPSSEHPISGHRLSSPLSEIQFEARLCPRDLPFFNDHRVNGAAILPAAAWIDALLSAGAAVFSPEPLVLEDLVLTRPLALTEDQTATVQIVLTPDEAGRYVARVYSQIDSDAEWHENAAAVLSPWSEEPPGCPPPVEIMKSLPVTIAADAHYTALQDAGLDFGPSLRGLLHAWKGENEALAQISLPEESSPGPFRIHPALLDAALQASAWAFPAQEQAVLPFYFERFISYRPGASSAWSWVACSAAPGGDSFTHLRVLDEAGELLAEATGIRFRPPSQGGDSSRVKSKGGIYRAAWKPIGQLDKEPSETEPSATELVPFERLNISLNSLSQGQSWLQYQAGMFALEERSREYILAALRGLGWQPALGDRFTTAQLVEELGVLPRYHKLLQRFLNILAEDGLLEAADGGWVAVQPLTTPGKSDTLAAPESIIEQYPEARAEIGITCRCGESLQQVLSGKIDPLSLLFPGGDTSPALALYADSPPARLYNTLISQAISAEVSSRPPEQALRVLEVGAGTGGTTGAVLQALPPGRTEYTFTDISPFFLTRAREKFQAYPSFKTALFDLEKELNEQSLPAGGFDIIIAANVIHATSDLRKILLRLRSLLAPGGLLLLAEVSRPQPWIDITFGLTDGWWRFSDSDLRPDYPLLPPQRWLALLQACGFQAAAFPSADSSGNWPQALLFARKPLAAESPEAEPVSLQAVKEHAWLIFADGPDRARPLMDRFAAHNIPCWTVLAGEGFEQPTRDEFRLAPLQRDHFRRLLAEVTRLSGLPIGGCIYLWGLDAPSVEAAAGQEALSLISHLCGGLLHLAQALVELSAKRPPRLVVTTCRAVQASHETEALSPAAASLWGLARSIGREYADLTPLVIDVGKADDPRLTQQIFAELTAPRGEEYIAIRDDKLLATRLQPRDAEVEQFVSEPKRLAITRRGSLDGLEVLPLQRAAPGPGQVEICVRAAGLNFKDVLNCLGMYPGDPGPLGSECAGIITAIGPGVDGFQVGDAVIAVTGGAFASYVCADAGLVVHKPAMLSWEAAASYPVAFLTAAYTLQHLAGLQAGESVLIHAAAGGVGLAAVQIAQRIGATVFATAGSEDKRAYLRSLGVRYVFDSRSTDFADQIKTLTKGYGVDVVLNSLAGDAIQAGLSLLAEGGRFLEIGKSGLLTPEEVANLGSNRRYYVVDWGETARAEPMLIRSQLLQLVNDLECGEMRLLPRQVFPFTEAMEAFRFMANAQHIGKLVFVLPRPPAVSLIRGDGAYLVTGGFGGLGWLTAGWLIQSGAGCVALVGRHPPSAEQASQMEIWKQSGVQVIAVTADVSRQTELEPLFARFGAGLPPLRGILHLAGTLNEAALLNMDWGRFEDVLLPKALGAWNMHVLSRNQPLDFFALFSSVASVFGSAGQSNHAAANAFLDTLAMERRRAGLPGLSIDWGAWAEVGAAAELRNGVTSSQGLDWISPDVGLSWLESLLWGSSGQVVAAPINWQQFLRSYPAGRTPAFLSEVISAQAKAYPARLPAAHPANDLYSVPPARRLDLIREVVRGSIRQVLGVDPAQLLGDHRPLNELGIDSLMSVELRNRLSEELKLDRLLPATLVFDYPTVEAITSYLHGRLFDPAGEASDKEATIPSDSEPEPSASPAVGAGIDLDKLLDAVENLSDEEVDRLLEQKQSGGNL